MSTASATPATRTRTYSRKHRMDAEALHRNNKRIKQTPANSANSDQVFELQSSVGSHVSPKDFSPVPAIPKKKTTASRRLKENSKSQGLASPFLKPQKALQRVHASSQSTKTTPILESRPQHHRRPSAPTPPRVEASTWLSQKQTNKDAPNNADVSPKVDFNRPPSQMDFNSMEVDLASFADFRATSTPPPGATSLQLMRNATLTIGSDSSDEDVLRSALANSSDEDSPFSSSSENAHSLRSAINLPDSKILLAKELDIQRIFSSLEIGAQPRQKLIRSISLDSNNSNTSASDDGGSESASSNETLGRKGRARRGTIRASEHNPSLQVAPVAPATRRTRSGTIVGPAHKGVTVDQLPASSSSLTMTSIANADEKKKKRANVNVSRPASPESDDELLLTGPWKDDDWISPGTSAPKAAKKTATKGMGRKKVTAA